MDHTYKVAELQARIERLEAIVSALATNRDFRDGVDALSWEVQCNGYSMTEPIEGRTFEIIEERKRNEWS